MKKNGGYTLLDLIVTMAVALSLLIGAVATTRESAGMYKDAKNAAKIASDIYRGVSTALLLKRGGCLNGVSITHADLISLGVPNSSVYPAPWITSVSYGYRGSEPTTIVVAIDVKSAELALNIFSDTGASNISGSFISFYYPIDSPRSNAFSEMYRNSSGCWAHGNGA